MVKREVTVRCQRRRFYDKRGQYRVLNEWQVLLGRFVVSRHEVRGSAADAEASARAAAVALEQRVAELRRDSP